MSKIILTSGAAPSTPASGTVAIYSDVTNKIRFKDDTGSETELVSSAADIRDLGFFDITNDGTSSGLDADLLDGSHASAFATAAQGTLANTALQNIVEDTTPQLGGNLYTGAFSITTGFGETVLSFSTDGEGAINWVDISAALIATGPTISAVGTDINIDLEISSKGTGVVNITGDVTVSNTVDGRDLATDGTKLDGIASGAEVNNGQDLGEFTVAGLPAAAPNANAYALATDASGGRTVVRSDGTDWKVVVVEGATVV